MLITLWTAYAASCAISRTIPGAAHHRCSWKLLSRASTCILEHFEERVPPSLPRSTTRGHLHACYCDVLQAMSRRVGATASAGGISPCGATKGILIRNRGTVSIDLTVTEAGVYWNAGHLHCLQLCFAEPVWPQRCCLCWRSLREQRYRAWASWPGAGTPSRLLPSWLR